MPPSLHVHVLLINNCKQKNGMMYTREKGKTHMTHSFICIFPSHFAPISKGVINIAAIRES